MKTLFTLTAIVCLMAFTATAETGNDVRKSGINTALITLPAMNWGSPEEVDIKL